ncbi:MAG: DUF177 domain-containing protein [Bacteroidetes bacterium]|nr:DUF177 domain-containing protein [Bacteroidota bacterium]
MVDNLKAFDIEFSALSIGKHQYSFEVDDTFFGCFENAVITNGKLAVKMELLRQTTMLQFNFDIDGHITTTCDRCTDDFEWQIHTKETLLVKIGDHLEEEDVDVYVIPQSQTHWNVAQQIYEYICMAKPLRTVHSDDAKGKSTCNAAFIAQLEKIVTKQTKKTEVDPRWDVLKKINNN